jgi:phage tail-like protein
MDANRTRLHLILGKQDWATCTDERGVSFSDAMGSGADYYLDSTVGLGWDDVRQEVILHPRLVKFKAAPRDVPPSIDDRRGGARDRYGNWYWIDTTKTEILVNSAGTGLTTHFWSSSDIEPQIEEPAPGGFQPKESFPLPTPLAFSGLSVTEDHFLVVGVLEPAGLLVFDLHAGGPPRQILWPESIDFVPFDMAPAPGGGVWILDRMNKRYWAMDRHLSVINLSQSLADLSQDEREDFQSKSETKEKTPPKGVFPLGLSLPVPSPLSASDPIAIEALPDGTVLILDTDFSAGSSAIVRYRFSQQVGKAAFLEEHELTGFDLAFVPEHYSAEGKKADRLYVVSSEGNQTYAFAVSLDEQKNLQLELVNEYYPMRLFGGKGLVASGTKVYYDFGTGWIPLIEQRRPKYTIEGTLETPLGHSHPAFDGREPDCSWHRLLIDACIPPETQIQVWSRADNDVGQLESCEWQKEPLLHRRGDGPELPYVYSETAKDSGTWELLFQRAIGRYLQLQLVFSGDGRSTPRVRALRIYYPRFSYPEHYLPAVYREDEQSASFLERFLANFEGTFTAIEDKIAAVQVLLDARSAPPETLEWLASWLGVAVDPKWDDSRRRLFIKHAMTFFQYRGTIRGLQLALRLALDECCDEAVFLDRSSTRPYAGGIRIVEKFRTRRSPGVMLGDPTEVPGPRTVSTTLRWQPSQGSDSLQQEYRKKFNVQETDSLPVKSPPEGRESEWKQFTREALGFVPSATLTDNALWQEFLARRHQHPSALNDAYKVGKEKRVDSFAEAELPEHLPADGAPLFDWYQFQTVVLAMHRLAHRFTVLIPLSKTDVEDANGQRQRLELAQRIVNLEKPAQTTFEVKFYWAFFRVGLARLGSDTLLDVGSRSPYLVSPMVLGRSYLLESYLAPGHPQNVRDRQVLGRDRLGK